MRLSKLSFNDYILIQPKFDRVTSASAMHSKLM